MTRQLHQRRWGIAGIAGVLLLLLAWLAFAPNAGAARGAGPANDALPASHDDEPATSITIDLPQGLSLLGWIGLPTTSTALIDGDPAIQTIFAWDGGWVSDSNLLPAALRVPIDIAQGDGVFVVTTAATSVEATLSVSSVAPLGVFMDAPGNVATNAGDPTGGSTTLTRTAAGVEITIDAASLTPGDAYSVWWVVFNNPGACTDDECGLDDVLAVLDPGVNPAEITLMNADGAVAGADGNASFFGRLLLNDTGDHEVLFGDGLTTIMGAEVHVIVRTHGPASADPDVLAGQLATFGESCTPESSFGIGAGDFGCFDAQDAVHLAP